MKNKLSQKQIREILSILYWDAHTDGRICGKSGKIDYGRANVTIEAVALRLGCKIKIDKK